MKALLGIAMFAATCVVGTGAMAQSIICNTIGSSTYCNGPIVAPPSPVIDYGFIAKAGPTLNEIAQAATLRQQQLRLQQQQARELNAEATAQSHQSVLNYVGRLAASGDCDGARKTALQAGDFDTAERVVGVCRPVPPEPAPAPTVIPVPLVSAAAPSSKPAVRQHPKAAATGCIRVLTDSSQSSC